jgi:UDP-GlcNAc:undecaprenyl-phosphate GlcNAc-1-phosphate transferase
MFLVYLSWHAEVRYRPRQEGISEGSMVMLALQWIPGLLFAFTVSLLLMPPLARSAQLRGWLDRPSGRKQHTGAVPPVGGVVMYLAFTVALLTLSDSAFSCLGLLAAMTLMTATGFVDDLRQLSTRSRFLMQAVAAFLIIVADGVRLDSLGDLFGMGEISLQFLAVPFTVFCTMGMINAVNLADGIDGLAGGLALLVTLWLSAFVLAAGYQGPDAMLPSLLAAAIMGFLCYNLRHPWRSRAAVFMGDSGSTMLGLTLVWLLVNFSQGDNALFAPVVALWIFALPLWDTVRLFIRRLRNGQNPFHGDRKHLHHLLLAAGYSDAQTTAMLLLTALLLGAVGMAGWYWRIPDHLLFCSFMVMAILYYFGLNYAWSLIEQARRGTESPLHGQSNA